MTTPVSLDLTIQQGETFMKVVVWEIEPYIYKAISGTIQQSAPAVIPCAGHGILNGWRVAVVGCEGMTEINASLDSNGAPRDPQGFRQATVRDANTIELNKVNASGYSPHVAGTGFLQFWTPKDLTGYSAQMMVKDKRGGAVLLTLTSANGAIFVDNTAKQVVITVTPAMTAGATWKNGVYDLEMVSTGGAVTKLLEGRVQLVPEVTT